MSSYIKIDPARVCELAATKIEELEKQQLDTRLRLLQNYVEKVNNQFLHKLFRVKDITIKNAASHLYANTHWMAHGNFDFEVYCVTKRVPRLKQLINAASAVAGQETMTLSVKDYNLMGE